MFKVSSTLLILGLVAAFSGNAFATAEAIDSGREEVQRKDITKAIDGKAVLPSDAHANATNKVVSIFGKNLVPADIASNPHFVADQDLVDVIKSLIAKKPQVIGFYRQVLAGMKGKAVTKQSKSSVRELALFLDAANPDQVVTHSSKQNVDSMIEFMNTYEDDAENSFNATLFYGAKALKANPNLSLIDALAQGMEDYLVEVNKWERLPAKAKADEIVRKSKCMGFAQAV